MRLEAGLEARARSPACTTSANEPTPPHGSGPPRRPAHALQHKFSLLSRQTSGKNGAIKFRFASPTSSTYKYLSRIVSTLPLASISFSILSIADKNDVPSDRAAATLFWGLRPFQRRRPLLVASYEACQTASPVDFPPLLCHPHLLASSGIFLGAGCSRLHHLSSLFFRVGRPSLSIPLPPPPFGADLAQVCRTSTARQAFARLRSPSSTSLLRRFRRGLPQRENFLRLPRSPWTGQQGCASGILFCCVLRRRSSLAGSYAFQVTSHHQTPSLTSTSPRIRIPSPRLSRLPWAGETRPA